jgi:hypothetical protein
VVREQCDTSRKQSTLTRAYDQFTHATAEAYEGNTAVRNFIEASRYERGLNPDGSPRK